MSSFASADLSSKVQECYLLDDTSGTTPLAEINAANNGTLATNSYTTTHKLGTGSVAKDASVLDFSPSSYTTANIKEIRYWYRRDAGTLSYAATGDANAGVYFWVDTTNEIKYYDITTRSTGVYIAQNRWVMITISDIDMTADTYSILLNNTIVAANISMRFNAAWNNAIWFDVGSSYFMDDVAIFNVSLTNAERVEDYNSGVGTACTFVDVPLINVSLNVIDSLNTVSYNDTEQTVNLTSCVYNDGVSDFSNANLSVDARFNTGAYVINLTKDAFNCKSFQNTFSRTGSDVLKTINATTMSYIDATYRITENSLLSSQKLLIGANPSGISSTCFTSIGVGCGLSISDGCYVVT